MRKLSLLFIVALVVPVSAADAPSIAGKWKVHNSIAGHESDQDCTFALSGKDISGTCTLEQGTAKVAGKVGDANFTWQFDTEYQGSPLTLIYTGTMDKDSKITGTVEVQPLSVQGDFTATPAK
jgi:hypothetical protein